MKKFKNIIAVLIAVFFLSSCGDGVHSGDAEEFFGALEPLENSELPAMLSQLKLPEGPYFMAGKRESGSIVFRFGTYSDSEAGIKNTIAILDSLMEGVGFKSDLTNTSYVHGEVEVDDIMGDINATRYYVNFETEQAVRFYIQEHFINEGNMDASLLTIEDAIIKPDNYSEVSVKVQSSITNFLNQFDDHEYLMTLPKTCSSCGLKQVPETYLLDTLQGKAPAYFDENWELVRALSKANERSGYYIVREILKKSKPSIAYNASSGAVDEFHTGHEKGLLYLVESSTGKVVAVKLYYAENSDNVYGEMAEMNSLLTQDLQEKVNSALAETKATLCGLPVE